MSHPMFLACVPVQGPATLAQFLACEGGSATGWLEPLSLWVGQPATTEPDPLAWLEGLAKVKAPRAKVTKLSEPEAKAMREANTVSALARLSQATELAKSGAWVGLGQVAKGSKVAKPAPAQPLVVRPLAQAHLGATFAFPTVNLAPEALALAHAKAKVKSVSAKVAQGKAKPAKLTEAQAKLAQATEALALAKVTKATEALALAKWLMAQGLLEGSVRPTKARSHWLCQAWLKLALASVAKPELEPLATTEASHLAWLEARFPQGL